ncbi:ParB/RepB/Spo0J family partition protein [Deinococcus multiflagellatus]|uniref:ParB/RepB/Spo0J family partition protein n=1 Tax=Deinococcus multiflagellatus TaxID=1656887 RepID=A0ABW1ZQG9_9DEIO
MPFPVPEEALDAALAAPQASSPATGWMFPNGSHLAHWGDGQSTLCGRYIPKGGAPVVGSDPTDFKGRRCAKCDKARERQDAEAFAAEVAQTYRVRAQFPDGTTGEGTVPSGKPHGRGADQKYNVARDLDGKRFDLPREVLTVAPHLAVGDRVWFSGSPKDAPVEITGFYTEEDKPHAARVRHDDGKVGGGHVGNMLRFVVTAAPEAAPAPTLLNGWMRKFGGGKVHWRQDGELLCGLPDDPAQPVINDDRTDEALLADACRTCRGRAKKLPVDGPQAAPDPVQATSEAPAEAPARFPVPEIAPLRTGLQELPWNQIVNSTLNPRKHFDLDRLRELAISIYRNGLRQNIQLRPHPTRPGFFEIAAGERRWRAIGLLVKGLEVGEGEARETLSVPPSYLVAARVDELSDRELVAQAMTENVERNDMSPLETANGYAALEDQGYTVEQIAQLFGKTPRTVQRMIDISRHLTGPARQMFDDRRLPIAAAEVLALASPAVQESVYKSHLKHGQVGVADVKKAALGHLFLVKHAKFPLDWYAGKVRDADLFGDFPAYFMDFDEALRCQLKHATALAEQDVRDGAAFADVDARAEQLTWNYDRGVAGATGVFYWINNRTGELTRFTNLRRAEYSKKDIALRLDAPQPVPVHETPVAAAPSSIPAPVAGQAPAPAGERVATPIPAAPVDAEPEYPDDDEAAEIFEARVLAEMAASRVLAERLMILSVLEQGYIRATSDGLRLAFVEVVRQLDGLLTLRGGDVLAVSAEIKEAMVLPQLLPALASLSDELHQALLHAACMEMVTESEIFSGRDYVRTTGRGGCRRGSWTRTTCRPATTRRWRRSGTTRIWAPGTTPHPDTCAASCWRKRPASRPLGSSPLAEGA